MSGIYTPLSVFTSLSYWFEILHILLFLIQFLTRIFDKVLNIVNCVLSFVWHFCNSVDCSLPGSTQPWISSGKNTGVNHHFLLQAIFPTQGSNFPNQVSCIAGGLFTVEPPGKPRTDVLLSLCSVLFNPHNRFSMLTFVFPPSFLQIRIPWLINIELLKVMWLHGVHINVTPPKAHALHSGPYPVSRLTFDQDQGFATLALFTCGDR